MCCLWFLLIKIYTGRTNKQSICDRNSIDLLICRIIDLIRVFTQYFNTFNAIIQLKGCFNNLLLHLSESLN